MIITFGSDIFVNDFVMTAEQHLCLRECFALQLLVIRTAVTFGFGVFSNDFILDMGISSNDFISL